MESIRDDQKTIYGVRSISNCDNPDVVWTVDKAIQNIREHFGAEE